MLLWICATSPNPIFNYWRLILAAGLFACIKPRRPGVPRYGGAQQETICCEFLMLIGGGGQNCWRKSGAAMEILVNAYYKQSICSAVFALG